MKNTVFDNTVHNSKLHGIEIRQITLRHNHGGSAIKLIPKTRKNFSHFNLDSNVHYLIILDRDTTLEDKYSSLVHELGHIFCGHLGIDPNAWWYDRHNLEKKEVEIEAESVSFLVCRRQGLIASSEKYLSNYRTANDQDIPSISLNAIFQATKYIEEMGTYKWKKPKKKSRYKKSDK